MAATGNEAFELHEATIDRLQEGMRSGQLTARRITELYLARIEALNQRGPELRAIIETNPDALAIADQLDAERKAGKVRGPLHGIPIALKDNLDTHDRMTTTAGSLALEGSIPLQDSFVAQQLRAAGAVLLAKATGAGGHGRPDRGLEGIIREAASSGVHFVLLNAIEDDLDAVRRERPGVVVATVCPDEVGTGRIQGQQMRALVPSGRRVLYVQGNARSLASRQRTEGMQEVMAGSGRDVVLAGGDWSPEHAEKTVRDWATLRGRRPPLVRPRDWPERPHGRGCPPRTGC